MDKENNSTIDSNEENSQQTYENVSSMIPLSLNDIKECVRNSQLNGISLLKSSLINKCGIIRLVKAENTNSIKEENTAETNEDGNSTDTNSTENNSTDSNPENPDKTLELEIPHELYYEMNLEVGKLMNGGYYIDFACFEDIPYSESTVSFFSNPFESYIKPAKRVFAAAEVPVLVTQSLDKNELLESACTKFNNFCTSRMISLK
eukprot:CAMPEP_0170522930 /NCGR_PEP_ID=MMETSP0209-20121228/8318_1 /TAXON_ID=665100 ORGANISM="Litonotus pictus, Strain P1" /NCGR_SAMPLE_ID=MMETSP0209 /ASSEMBLY_ACC=CAM_ASM_000301 /LENGTH=204 /DNA_ID=CAMNT_0010810675 /DNA_START=2233 /DNA_END=2844 /DNA_ORIENTATION=-